MTVADEHDQPQVDAGTLSHWDFFDKDHWAAKWELFAHSRQHCPVVRTDANGGFYLVTTYDDVRRVLEDWQTFSSIEASLVPPGIRLCPMDVDPPVHTAMRAFLNPLFSRSALARYEPAMRGVARSLIDEWLERGSVEILTEFAGPYVGKMLVEIIFDVLSETELDRARDLALRISEHASSEVFAELLDMCKEYLERVRTSGTSRDGVIARLMTVEIDGRAITEEEQLGVLAILVLGGLDTTRAAIGNITYRITESPGLEDLVRTPGWLHRNVDEFLRLDSPVGGNARTATRDVVLRGVPIRAGERVQVRFDAANRDPARFDQPDQLDFAAGRGGHMAFGLGVHRCVGSNLARMQIEIAFEELLARIHNLRLASGAQIEWVAGMSNVLHTVEINFDTL